MQHNEYRYHFLSHKSKKGSIDIKNQIVNTSHKIIDSVIKFVIEK